MFWTFSTLFVGLKHVVITSVDRDDLENGGAGIFEATSETVRRRSSHCIVEVLVPDFQSSTESLKIVLEAAPEILNHNMETVPRLYPIARGGEDYHRSLELLPRAQQWAPDIVTKTGMMLGLGEQEKEIHQVMHDLIEPKVSILTLGQYLRPTGWHLPVAHYYSSQEFQYWKELGESMGFRQVESGPLVRSSYLADRQFASLNGFNSRL